MNGALSKASFTKQKQFYFRETCFAKRSDVIDHRVFFANMEGNDESTSKLIELVEGFLYLYDVLQDIITDYVEDISF